MSYEEFKRIKVAILEKQKELMEIERKLKALQEASAILGSSGIIQGMGSVQKGTRISDNDIILYQVYK